MGVKYFFAAVLDLLKELKKKNVKIINRENSAKSK